MNNFAEIPIDLCQVVSFLDTHAIKSLILLQSRFRDCGATIELCRNDGGEVQQRSMVRVLYCDDDEVHCFLPESVRCCNEDVGMTVWLAPFSQAQEGPVACGRKSKHEVKMLTLQKSKGSRTRIGFMDFILLLARTVKSELHYPMTAVCVGVLVKPSRWQMLARRGMLPFLPTRHNIFYIPILDYDNLEGGQIDEIVQVVDILLHKPTDFMTMITRNGEAQYNAKFLALLNAFSKASNRPVVDPLSKFTPVVNRVLMMEALERACKVAQGLAGLDVRIPAFATINDSRCSPPGSAVPGPLCIVKPVAACGVPESHRMAIVYTNANTNANANTNFDWGRIKVPMPAIIQEYINHDATLFKVYVAGDMVFVEKRESLPNLPNESPPAPHDCIFYFDSLEKTKSEYLLSQMDYTIAVNTSTLSETGNMRHSESIMDWMVENEYSKLARILKDEFQLTLFGFDVIFERVHRKAVIIDLNYFPSYNSVKGAAIAMQDALKAKLVLKKD